MVGTRGDSGCTIVDPVERPSDSYLPFVDRRPLLRWISIRIHEVPRSVSVVAEATRALAIAICAIIQSMSTKTLQVILGSVLLLVVMISLCHDSVHSNAFSQPTNTLSPATYLGRLTQNSYGKLFAEEGSCSELKDTFVERFGSVLSIDGSMARSHFSSRLQSCFVEIGEYSCLNGGGCLDTRAIYQLTSSNALVSSASELIAQCSTGGEYCFKNVGSGGLLSRQPISKEQFRNIETDCMAE
jgi:hypothetical protein